MFLFSHSLIYLGEADGSVTVHELNRFFLVLYLSNSVCVVHTKKGTVGPECILVYCTPTAITIVQAAMQDQN